MAGNRKPAEDLVSQVAYLYLTAIAALLAPATINDIYQKAKNSWLIRRGRNKRKERQEGGRRESETKRKRIGEAKEERKKWITGEIIRNTEMAIHLSPLPANTIMSTYSY